LGACPGFHSEIAFSTLNSAKNMGSWSTTGRQPISGLTPACWYSFIVSCCSVCLSFLYFLRSAVISGASADIARVVCICLMNSGTMISRMSTTRITIESAQVHPLVVPRSGLRKP
jgi:hypothetical protein